MPVSPDQPSPRSASPGPFDLPPPAPDALAHSERLQALIARRIEDAGGWLPFSEYMRLALYAPALGYYVAGARALGAHGDFVTAPEISPLFGGCLARACAPALAETGGEILEFGAGSGRLAADLLERLAALGQPPTAYRILEVSPSLRARQRETLAARVPELLERVQWLDGLPESLDGVVIANEVLDAMPVERFAIRSAGLMRGGVALRDGRCVAAERPVPDGLRRIVEALLSDLPQALAPDYASELNPQLEAWTAALAARLTRGLLLLIDYGYPRPLYYAPERAMGTLLCHYRHRAHDDPFLWPGLQDITASVDFTAVAEAGVAAGLDLVGYTTQGNFLIGSGMETEFEALRAAEPEGLHRLSQQVQQLTLPGEMGERFQVLGLARGLDAVPTGFSLRDLRNRL